MYRLQKAPQTKRIGAGTTNALMTIWELFSELAKIGQLSRLSAILFFWILIFLKGNK